VFTLHFNQGPVNSSDIDLASSLQPPAVVYGFNLRASKAIEQQASEAGVAVVCDPVIYRLVEDAEARLLRAGPATSDRVLGELEVADTFALRGKSKGVVVAGCQIFSGAVREGSSVSVLRGGGGGGGDDDEEEEEEEEEQAGSCGSEIFRGVVASLRVHKDVVAEVLHEKDPGGEAQFCGLQLEDKGGVLFACRAGDRIRVVEESARY